MTERLTLEGACSGYKRGAIFKFVGGQTWEQTSSDYSYSYQYRPEAELDAWGNTGRLKIEGMDDWIDVKRVR